MLSDLIIVVGQVFTLFLMMAVGFILARLGWFSADTSGQVTRLLLYIVAPAIIIIQLQMDVSMEVLRSMLMAILALAVPYVITIPLSQLLFRKEPHATAVSKRFGLVYGNNGFMGIPLLLGVLGQEAVLFGALSMLLFNIFEWTHGAVIMGGKLSPKSALLNPGIVGLVVGMGLFLLGIRLPSPIYNAVNYMSSLNTPLAMVVIGAQMARADILGVVRKPKLYLHAALRLVLVPALTAVIILPLNLEPLVYCSCVVLAACPTAAATSMFAQMFHQDEETAAQTVTLSTLLSILTLPIFAVIARTVSGLA